MRLPVTRRRLPRLSEEAIRAVMGENAIRFLLQNLP